MRKQICWQQRRQQGQAVPEEEADGGMTLLHDGSEMLVGHKRSWWRLWSAEPQGDIVLVEKMQTFDMLPYWPVLPNINIKKCKSIKQTTFPDDGCTVSAVAVWRAPAAAFPAARLWEILPRATAATLLRSLISHRQSYRQTLHSLIATLYRTVKKLKLFRKFWVFIYCQPDKNTETKTGAGLLLLKWSSQNQHLRRDLNNK